MAEIFPPSWYYAEFQGLVEDFIRNLPISWEDKKQLLLEWCDRAGVECTAEKVARVIGVPAGEI